VKQEYRGGEAEKRHVQREGTIGEKFDTKNVAS
jgi:hypothetical protein